MRNTKLIAEKKTQKSVNYVVLYYTEREWLLNPYLYHQIMFIIGQKAQLWISGLTWGYYGEGPDVLHDLLQIIDPGRL